MKREERGRDRTSPQAHIVHLLPLFRNTSSYKWSTRVSMLSLFDLGKPWLKGLFIAAIFKLYRDVNFNDTIDT